MIRLMTIDDYENLIEMWKQTLNMGLRSLDDSKEGITIFLERNPNTNFPCLKSLLCPIFRAFVNRPGISRDQIPTTEGLLSSKFLLQIVSRCDIIKN